MAAVLQPTLWRTCRVIANAARLEIFAFLLKNPGQPVTSVAEHFNISLSSASEHLRLLESRGLLSVQRARRWVKYRVVPSDRENPGSALAIAMKTVFQRDRNAAQSIFKSATAFTHPRRVEVFRLLRDGPKSFDQLRHASRISLWALYRHLKKLEVRGFVRLQKRFYVTTEPTDALQRELARLAAMAE
jgi:DNA-binding transcriptional ArsR family regulator